MKNHFAILAISLMLAACSAPKDETQNSTNIQSANDAPASVTETTTNIPNTNNQLIEASIKTASDTRVKNQLKLFLEQGTDAEKALFAASGDTFEFPERLTGETAAEKAASPNLVCRKTRVCGEPQEICTKLGPGGECLRTKIVQYCWWEPVEPCEPVCTPGHAC